MFVSETIMKQVRGCGCWSRGWRISTAILLAALCPAVLPAANIGTVVSVVGQATDLVYDGQRSQVYICNYTQNRIEVYSIAQQRLLSPINIGNSPGAPAIFRYLFAPAAPVV